MKSAIFSVASITWLDKDVLHQASFCFLATNFFVRYWVSFGYIACYSCDTVCCVASQLMIIMLSGLCRELVSESVF